MVDAGVPARNPEESGFLTRTMNPKDRPARMERYLDSSTKLRPMLGSPREQVSLGRFPTFDRQSPEETINATISTTRCWFPRVKCQPAQVTDTKVSFDREKL